MLFITNRNPVGSIRSRIGRNIRFDDNNNSTANSAFYCHRDEHGHYTEIGSQTLMGHLRTTPHRQILLYFHGFNNLPERDIFPNAQKLQQLLDDVEPNLALVVPLIWPCDNDFGLIKDYWDDQKSADMSSYAFARVLEKFMAWRDSPANEPASNPCTKRINLLSHSMGNRVLRETLRTWYRYDLMEGVPLLFRNIFMLAPDIVNESLEIGGHGEFITHAARNVTVYYAADDLALRASKVSNLKNKIASRRLGHTGPEDMSKVRKNVYAIDCDNFNNRYDTPLGHTYFLHDDQGGPGKVFSHIAATLKHGRVFPHDPDRRTDIL